MDKRELRNAKVELIYLYIERVTDMFNQDMYTNISLNLCSNITAAYDYEKGLLHIDRRKKNPDDFWSLKQDADTNVIDNVLILGENGTGKTTLLELIYAGNLENIESRLGNYMFLYSIKGTNMYYIKSFGLTWIDQIDFGTCRVSKQAIEKSSKKGNKEFYSRFFRAKDNGMSAKKGYYGLIAVDTSGKINVDKNVLEVNTQVERKVQWDRMPMDGIYLPISITEYEETGRFVTRKRIHYENTVTNSEITEFIINDMKKENGIMKSNPYLSFSNISVKDLVQNKQAFIEQLTTIYTKTNVSKTVQIESAAERKYQFLSVIWVNFMLKLHVDQFLNDNFIDYLKETTTFRTLFDIVKGLFTKLFKYDSKDLYEMYKNLLLAVENLDDKLFEQSTVKRVPLGLSWNVPVKTIVKKNEWCNQMLEFINIKDDFENNLQAIIQKNIRRDYVPPKMMNHYISNMSSGETVLISNVFSKISKNMKTIINRVNEPHTILLIMDEPDCTFHIRWTQQFNKYLIEFLNTHYPEFSFQIIMTSHMPFLATDYPRGNIICIPSEEWKKSQVGNDLEWMDGSRLLQNKEMYNSLKAFTPKYGFMSNYYDVVKDNFFVDIPIGMFAQNKFDELKKKVDLITSDTSEQMLENISMEIELIDEPVLKKYIYDSFQEKLAQRRGRIELEREAALLEKRLEGIKRRLNDMR